MGAMSTSDLGMPPVLDLAEADGRAVLLAAPRGYCAGVDRAVITVEKALDLYGAPVYVRKQIVHNKHVVSNLESRGAVFVEELAEVPEGATVVFSAHGVSPEVHRQAEERSLKTIDATCPLVTKVHHEARRFAGDDYDILLIGHAGHEEVEGTAGRPRAHPARGEPRGRRRDRGARPGEGGLAVADHPVRRRDDGHGAGDPRALPAAAGPAVGRHLLRHAEPADGGQGDLRRRRPRDRGRLRELLQLGAAVEVALEAGAKASYRVDDASEIDEAWLEGVDTVSVTSGASVPEDLVEGVLAFLAERGYPDAKAVHTAEESLIFALPPELRRDMRAAEKAQLSRPGASAGAAAQARVRIRPELRAAS